jgi:hypothetical protein
MITVFLAVGDLRGGEGDASGGVDDDVDRGLVGGEADGPEDLLAVVDVDVPGDGEAEEAECLLPVDEGDDIRPPLPAEVGQLPFPGPVESLLAEPGPD